MWKFYVVSSLTLTAVVLLMSTTAFAGFYKFTGDISYVWNQDALSTQYRVGNTVSFVFRIDADSPGTGYTTQVDGDRLYTAPTPYINAAYYAEYLGGDAIIYYDNNIKASLDPNDTWEYNHAVDADHGTYSDLNRWGVMSTETESNRIRLQSDEYHKTPWTTVPYWDDMVGQNRFDLLQTIKWMEGGEDMWAQYRVENIVLSEYQDELTDMNLAGINLKSTVVTPVPGAVWMFGAGLIGLFGLRRKFSA